MLRVLKYFIYFLIFLAVALVFNLPIQKALPYVDLPQELRVAGVDGTMLKGRADELRINQFPVRNVKYRFMPSCIPQLKVCYEVIYDQGEIRMGYDLLHGDIELFKSVIEYPVAELMRLVPNTLPVRPSGSLELQIQDLSMEAEHIAAINGNLVWRNLGLNDQGIKLDIGDYLVEFSGDGNQYDLNFSDLNAALDVGGKGRINNDGRYNIDVTIDAKRGIDPQVKSVLNLVAARAGVNKYRVRQQGQLPRSISNRLFP